MKSSHRAAVLGGILAVCCSCGKAETRVDHDGSGALAVASLSTQGEEPTRRPIELFSWWAKVRQSDTLAALQRVHEGRNPGDIILNASAELSGAARRTLRERMSRGEPPDTFQANIGNDLMRWVLVNGVDERESRLVPLDDAMPEVAEWRTVIPSFLLNELSYDGKLYAVPATIHRENVIFYNRHVFETYGLAEFRGIDDLLAAGAKLRQDGRDLIALGSREPWTLALMVFEDLLVAREGLEFYRDYFSGHLDAADPRVRATLTQSLKLLEYANQDHRQQNWVEAVEAVIRGRAAMTIMGDWARVLWTSKGLEYGKDFGEIPFPGTAQAFIYTSDTFPLPVSAKNTEGAKRLLSTIASKEAQIVLSRAKGAISPRSDVTMEDPRWRAEYELFVQGPRALALSGMIPASFAEELGAALAEMAAQSDIEPVLQTLRSRYRTLN